MSVFLLDTDTITLIERQHPVVMQNINSHSDSDINSCSVVIQEQIQGFLGYVNKARNDQALEKAHQLLVQRFLPIWKMFVVLPFTVPAIQRFQQLRSMKLNVGTNDLRIASIALEHGLTVVSRNQRDFKRVPGLQVVDWSV